MKEELISQGAEAKIYLKEDKIIKRRISKKYRHPILDKRLIKRRTKAETKILKLTEKLIPAPRVIEQNRENEIIMEFIKGEKLATHLNNYSIEKQNKILEDVGKNIAKIHEKGIIHGDLTTSNMIYSNDKTYIIDFGLSSLNGKYEQKAVDLHVLKEALRAKHFKTAEQLFEKFKIGYSSINPKEAKKVFERLISVEKRGRYKRAS